MNIFASMYDPGTLIAELPPMFRFRDVEAYGVPRPRLEQWLESGEVEKLDRGLYRKTSAPVTEHETRAMVAARVPGSVMCLMTALNFHEIGTQLPRHVWIAVPTRARIPKTNLPVRVVRFSPAMMRVGVEEHILQGVPVKVTSPARTVADCFRMRKVVGIDVTIEALRETLRYRKATPDQILRAAEVSRVRKLIEPYLDTLLA